MDSPLSPSSSLPEDDDSFLTWEKMCELSYPKIDAFVDLTAISDDELLDGSASYAADNEASNINDTNLHVSSQSDEYNSPLPGSCDFLKNRLDPNTAICNLNDTLEAVEFMLAQNKNAADETEKLEHVSSVTLVSTSDDSSDTDSVYSVEDVEEVFESSMDGLVVSPQPKCPRKTGKILKLKINSK